MSAYPPGSSHHADIRGNYRGRVLVWKQLPRMSGEASILGAAFRGQSRAAHERDLNHGAERGAFLHLRGVPYIFFYRAAVRMPTRTATSANLIPS